MEDDKPTELPPSPNPSTPAAALRSESEANAEAEAGAEAQEEGEDEAEEEEQSFISLDAEVAAEPEPDVEASAQAEDSASEQAHELASEENGADEIDFGNDENGADADVEEDNKTSHGDAAPTEPSATAQEDSPGSSKEEGEMSDASAASFVSRPSSSRSPPLKRKAPIPDARQASPKRQRSRHAPSPIRHPQQVRRSPRRSAGLQPQHRSRTPPRWQPTRSPSPATMLRLREVAAKHVYEPASLPVRRRRSPSPILRRQVVRPVSPVRRVVMDEGEVEELFRTALKNAALEKRPPFNISLINDRMRLLNRRYDVRHTSFGSFAAMATHFERKGLLVTRRDRHSVVIVGSKYFPKGSSPVPQLKKRPGRDDCNRARSRSLSRARLQSQSRSRSRSPVRARSKSPSVSSLSADRRKASPTSTSQSSSPARRKRRSPSSSSSSPPRRRPPSSSSSSEDEIRKRPLSSSPSSSSDSSLPRRRRKRSESSGL